MFTEHPVPRRERRRELVSSHLELLLSHCVLLMGQEEGGPNFGVPSQSEDSEAQL